MGSTISAADLGQMAQQATGGGGMAPSPGGGAPGAPTGMPQAPGVAATPQPQPIPQAAPPSADPRMPLPPGIKLPRAAPVPQKAMQQPPSPAQQAPGNASVSMSGSLDPDEMRARIASDLAPARGAVNKIDKSINERQTAVDEQGKKADDAAATAADLQAQKQIEMAKELDPMYKELQVNANKISQKIQWITDNADKQTQEWEQKVVASQQAVQNFQFQDYFADKSTFGKVMGIIASALGGAANGIAGTPGAKTPMDLVIERDMQLQQAKFGKLKEDAELNKGILQQLRESTGSAVSANVAFLNASYAKVSNMVDIVGQRLNTPANIIAQTKSALEQQKLTRMEAASNAFRSNATATLGSRVGLAADQANHDTQIDQFQMKLAAVQAKGAKPDKQVAQMGVKEKDAVNAINEADVLLANGKGLSIAQQKALKQSVAEALSNAPTRNVSDSSLEAHTAQSAVVGNIPFLSAFGTKLGINADETRKNLADIKKQIILKQQYREQGAAGGFSNTIPEPSDNQEP